MILAISRFRVANGMEEEVRAAFLARPRFADTAPGFLGLETWTEASDPSVFHLVTRWTDEESFRRWHRSPEHHRSHPGIPRHLKLDAAFTSVTILERVERTAGPAPEERLLDRASLFARLVAGSVHLHYLEVSPEGTIRHANAAAAAVFGEAPDALPGRSLWELLGESSSRTLRERVEGGTRDLEEHVLLNVVAGARRVSLKCLVDVQPDGFVLVGERPEREGRPAEEELARIANELAVLSREGARRARTLEERLGDLETAYWHIRKVQEVLPLCLECGRVRTGEDRWETLLDFMTANSLFLSHGLCPDCAPGFGARLRGAAPPPRQAE